VRNSREWGYFIYVITLGIQIGRRKLPFTSPPPACTYLVQFNVKRGCLKDLPVLNEEGDRCKGCNFSLLSCLPEDGVRIRRELMIRWVSRDS